MWHFNRANLNSIKEAVRNFDWTTELGRFEDTTCQVEFFNKTLLNIMSNFVPNEMKSFNSHKPPWFNGHIKNLLRKQNNLYRKYKNNGFNPNDKLVLDNHRSICSQAIIRAKDNYLRREGDKLSDNSTAQKTYWKILNTFLNKCKLPRIPPLFFRNHFVIDCKEKAKIFNEFFA